MRSNWKGALAGGAIAGCLWYGFVAYGLWDVRWLANSVNWDAGSRFAVAWVGMTAIAVGSELGRSLLKG